MGAREFLNLVMPSGGNKIVTLVKPGRDGGTWFKYKHYETTREAADAAEFFDEKGETVYFAVNAFGDWYEDAAKGKKRIRTQENVVACRSLYDDFDVDPKDDRKYDSRKDALADIVRLAKALRLTPTVTSSGGGYHCYFHADADMTRSEWEELVALKRDVTHHMGLKVDRAVDMDSARILRPVGTHNRKTGQAVPVEVVRWGKQYPAATLRERLQEYIRDNGVQPAPTSHKKAAAANPFGAALGEFPPSDAEKVAEHCAAVREFRDTGGRIPEPHWHRAIGVVKFCEDGERYVHDWSSGYEDYSETETQEKIDEWTVGPTSCAEMDKHVGCMANCPFANKVRFPIQLGFTEDAPSVAEESTPEPSPADETTVIEGQKIPYWPKNGYRWNGSNLSRSYVDDEGVIHWRPFCRTFVYPVNRIRDSEGNWAIHWRAKDKSGDWREFFMPTEELASADMMAKRFASQEIFLTRTRNARSDMGEFAEGLIETLQEWRIETKTYKQFGWTDDFSGFVLGTTMITKNGEQEVLCDPAMPMDVAVDFGVSGTVEEWVSNIDTLFNRPGAEPFQFALCHAMGSLLVELFGSSNWHGLPLAFTGHGGTGKSTAAKIACGFYGHPRFMERQTGEQGSTLNAAIKRIAIMGSVPVLLDEFSGRSPDELTRTGYALANGRDKERLGANGQFSTVGGEWFKNSFITSNDSIHDSISKLPAGYRVEATQLRFFEVQLPDNYIQEVFSDVSQAFIEHHMDNVYGAPLRPYLRFLLKNRDWVRRQIVAARDKFNPQSDDDNKERFYRDTIVTALVAGKIAEKLGLIRFDLKNMKKWALEQVVQMRESRRESNIDIGEHLAQFIATLPGRLIITKRFGDSRSTKEEPQEILRAPAVGRVCTEDKKVYIAVRAMNDWCRDNGVNPGVLREEMDRQGYLIATPDGELTRKVYIGAGTTMPSGQMRCVEVKFHKLFDGKNLSVVPTEGGVATQSANSKED